MHSIISWFVNKRGFMKVKTISYLVSRGKNRGVKLSPHIHSNGMFVVSPSRFQEDYIYVSTLDDVLEYLNKGLKVRVSGIGLDGKKVPTSLVNFSSLTIDYV